MAQSDASERAMQQECMFCEDVATKALQVVDNDDGTVKNTFPTCWEHWNDYFSEIND